MATRSRFLTMMKQNEDERRNSMIDTYLKVVQIAQTVYNLDSQKLYEAVQIIGQSFEDVDFTVPENYVAGLFMIEPAICEGVFLHMSSFMRKYPATLTPAGKTIKIVCLSDGTGFESLGLIRSLSEFESAIGTPRKFEITVLGKTLNWHRFFSMVYSDILDSGGRTPLSAYLNKIPLTIQFLEGDVENYYGALRENPVSGTKANSEKVLDVVRKADVVILARFLKYSLGADIKSIIEGVGRCMKQASLLYLGIQESRAICCNEYMASMFVTAHKDTEDIILDPTIQIDVINPVLNLPSYPSVILWKNIL